MSIPKPEHIFSLLKTFPQLLVSSNKSSDPYYNSYTPTSFGFTTPSSPRDLSDLVLYYSCPHSVCSRHTQLTTFPGTHQTCICWRAFALVFPTAGNALSPCVCLLPLGPYLEATMSTKLSPAALSQIPTCQLLLSFLFFPGI